ncbi:MAG: hypothetical protein ACOYMN_14035, partial [Roseimicrobium sp.]
MPTPKGRAEYANEARGILQQRPPELRWLRTAVLANYTTEFLAPYLVVEGARCGVGLDIWSGPYGQIEQQALDAASELFARAPEVVLILPQIEDWAPVLARRFMTLGSEEIEQTRSDVRSRFVAVLASIRQHSEAKILLGNFVPPVWSSAGSVDVGLVDSLTGTLQRLNEDLAAVCRDVSDAAVLDMACVAREVGSRRWRDERMAWLARAPLSGEAMAAVGKAFARRVRACLYPQKKCLVLDMDNTLWGGVVGEAGMDGIQLGPD